MDGLILIESILALAVVGVLVVLKRGIAKHNRQYDEGNEKAQSSHAHA